MANSDSRYESLQMVPGPYSPYESPSLQHSPYQQSPTKSDYVTAETTLLAVGNASHPPSGYSNPNDPSNREQYDDSDKIYAEDQRLKHRIRQLKATSRAVAVVLSIATLIPLAMTIWKYEQTKNIFRQVTEPDGTVQNRNLWAFNTRTWPTIMYTAVAAVSVVLNLAVMVSYLRDVRRANRTAKIASMFSWAILLGNLCVWIAAAIIYRKEKNPDANGKHTDLWGWTCSKTAQQIQRAFQDEISFNQYCDIQSASWFIGVIQCVVAALSALTYYLSLKRLRVKKVMQQGRQDQQPVYAKI